MSNRFVVVSFLDKAPSKRFKSNEWPLHMTLLRPFIYDGPLELINENLNDLAKQLNPFTIKTSEDALFGPKENIPVQLVEINPGLSILHLRLAGLVTKLSLEYEYPALSEEGYRFHITTQRGQKAPSNMELPVTGFSLVDRQADSEKGLKRAVNSFELGQHQSI